MIGLCSYRCHKRLSGCQKARGSILAATSTAPFPGTGFKSTLILIAVLAMVVQARASAPKIYNVYASQQSASRLVDITYDAVYSGGTLTVNVDVSTNAGVSYTLPATHFSGDIGEVDPGRNLRIVWDAEADWPGMASGAMRVRVTATAPGSDVPAPSGMRTIPSGSFSMGDPHGTGGINERPRHEVTLGRFHIDQHHITKSLWDSVKVWAQQSSLPYAMGAGSGKPNDHPIQSVNWYDAVKWCNARSEMEGRRPCYYLTPALTDVYRSGDREDLTNDCVRVLHTR